MSKIIIIIPSPNESVDILSLISRFARELKRANKQIIILRANVVSDAQVIDKLASKYNIARIPCMLYNNTVVIGQSRVCSSIATIIKSIRSGHHQQRASEQARSRAPCPSVNQYMTQIMLSGEDDAVDDDPEKAKEQMAQRMADYRERTKMPAPDDTGGARTSQTRSAPRAQRRTTMTTPDSREDDEDMRQRNVGTIVEQETPSSETYDVVHSVESDSEIKMRPINPNDIETSVRQSVNRLKSTANPDQFEDQFYSSIADYAAMS